MTSSGIYKRSRRVRLMIGMTANQRIELERWAVRRGYMQAGKCAVNFSKGIRALIDEVCAKVNRREDKSHKAARAEVVRPHRTRPHTDIVQRDTDQAHEVVAAARRPD